MPGPELALIDSWDEAQAFMTWLGERRPILAFDVETEGLDPWRDRVRLAQFGDTEAGWAMPYGDWRGLVKEVFESYTGPLVAHNAKFDVSMMEQDDVTVPRDRFHDTMIMCHLVDSQGPKDLKSAAKRYVAAGAKAGDIALKSAMKRTKWTWATIPIEFDTYWTYAALDTVLTARLAEKLWPLVQPYRDAYETEMAVSWVLLDMEERGARIDLDYCRKMHTELSDELETITHRWPETNLMSSGQVMKTLEGEGFRFTKRTAKRNLSLDDDVLAGIDHPLARDVQRARECDRWLSTYIGAYLRLEVDGVVHCNVNPLGAERTGRMSISRPSMQNIPRRREVRDAFIPREGNVLMLADYQAQETRLIAHFARERNLIEAFERGEDIHEFVARIIYGDPVTPVRRYRAKTCGHASNYGAQPAKIAVAADISLKEARDFALRYDQAFPGIGRFVKKVIAAVRDRDEGGYGYVVSYGGRRIRVPVEKVFTAAVNYLIQGSGSDALKRGLVNLDRMGIAQFAVLPVHDEVIYDIPVEEVDEVMPMIHEAFEHTDLACPLPIETKVVQRWGDAYAA